MSNFWLSNIYVYNGFLLQKLLPQRSCFVWYILHFTNIHGLWELYFSFHSCHKWSTEVKYYYFCLCSLHGVLEDQEMLNLCEIHDTVEEASRQLAFFFPDLTKKKKGPDVERTLALIRPALLRERRGEWSSRHFLPARGKCVWWNLQDNSMQLWQYQYFYMWY